MSQVVFHDDRKSNPEIYGDSIKNVSKDKDISYWRTIFQSVSVPGI